MFSYFISSPSRNIIIELCISLNHFRYPTLSEVRLRLQFEFYHPRFFVVFVFYFAFVNCISFVLNPLSTGIYWPTTMRGRVHYCKDIYWRKSLGTLRLLLSHCYESPVPFCPRHTLASPPFCC